MLFSKMSLFFSALSALFCHKQILLFLILATADFVIGLRRTLFQPQIYGYFLKWQNHRFLFVFFVCLLVYFVSSLIFRASASLSEHETDNSFDGAATYHFVFPSCGT